MQSESKIANWPILLLGIILVATLLAGANIVVDNHVLSNYMEDIAGAITVIILSVMTYDEWERQRERGRYQPSEQMGVRRVKDEIFQLLY
jgi:hypothetical protein